MLKNATRKIRHRLVWLLLAILLQSPSAYACLQGEEGTLSTLLVGKDVKVEGVSASDFAKSFVTHAHPGYWERVRSMAESKKPQHRNNMAVALIHLGRVAEAIPILEEVERQSPGLYLTAANLGTAYELVGDNRRALQWIREGVQRNPDSHEATEWLHVKILEAKLALESNPAWLSTNSVLGVDLSAQTDENRKHAPVMDHLGRTKSQAEVETALVYQLHERMEFVRPPDPVVADLLLALSNLMGRTRSEEHARLVRDLAYNYGAAQTAPATSNQPAKGSPPSQSPALPYLRYSTLAGAALLLLAGLLYALSKRRRLR